MKKTRTEKVYSVSGFWWLPCDGNQKSVVLDVVSRWLLKIIQGISAQELEEKEKMAGQIKR